MDSMHWDIHKQQRKGEGDRVGFAAVWLLTSLSCGLYFPGLGEVRRWEVILRCFACFSAHAGGLCDAP